MFLSELKMKGSYNILNFVIFKNLICALESQSIQCSLCSGFYFCWTQASIWDIKSKLSQNFRENYDKIVHLRCHWSERSTVKFKLQLELFNFLVGYLDSYFYLPIQFIVFLSECNHNVHIFNNLSWRSLLGKIL